jgi:hypothetical protein
VEVGHHHRHRVKRVRRFEQFVVLGALLIGARRHDLERRIPRFHDMPADVRVIRQAVRYRHDQRVTARAEACLKRGDVQQDPVADARRPDKRRVRKRANRNPAHGYHEFGSPGPLAPQRRDNSAPPSDHDGRLAAGRPQRRSPE